MGGEQQRRDRAAVLRVLQRAAGELVSSSLVALDQVDREIRCGLRLLADVLEDRQALVAGEDVLDALDGGVLTGDRDLLALLQRGDRGGGDAVVRGEHALHPGVLAVGLLEVGRRDGVVPLRDVDLDLGLDARLVEDVVRTGLEQHRVVVDVGATVELDDVRVAGDALRLQAVEQTLRLLLTDLEVVERHVVVGRTTEVDAVVVDDRDARGLGLLLDGDAGRRVSRVDQQDVDLVGDHLLRDGDELRVRALRVLDVGLDAGRIERLLQQGSVVKRVTVGGRRVREDHAHRAAATRAATGGGGRRRRRGRRVGVGCG